MQTGQTHFSTNCSPAALSAFLKVELDRFGKDLSSRRLAKSLALVRSWQLTPGISSIHPIRQSLSCFTTAVYSMFISIVYDISSERSCFNGQLACSSFSAIHWFRLLPSCRARTYTSRWTCGGNRSISRPENGLSGSSPRSSQNSR